MGQSPRSRFTLRRRYAWLLLACAFVTVPVSSCAREEARGTPEELIAKAWKDFQTQDFQTAAASMKAALHKLDQLKAQGHAPASESALRSNALYGLGLVGTVGRPSGNSDEGRRYLQQVIAENPHTEIAAWAALALVRDLHLPQTSTETINIPRLRTLYQQVIDAYPKTPAAEEAFLYLESLNIETLDPTDARRAVDAINAYLPAHPDTRFRSALYDLASQADVTLKDYPAALDNSIHALDTKEIDPNNPTLNNVLEYYRIGLMAQYDVGDFATARKYYHKFLDEYPTDQRAFNVKLELAGMDRLEGQMRAAPTSQPAPAPEGRPQ